MISSSSRVKRGSGFNPVTPTFASFGRYADVGSERIESSHPGLRLHGLSASSPRSRWKLTSHTEVGSSSTLYVEKGTLLGMNITYLSQVLVQAHVHWYPCCADLGYSWDIWDAESTQVFYEQVLPYIHPETLRPLMGICVPTTISLYSAAAGRLSLAVELPHHVGWREADPYISVELKEKVITAYQNIHGRGILHNDVKLENVLIGWSWFLSIFPVSSSPRVGDDDKVTIVDFCKMVVNPEPADLALEMRVVKFILDHDDAKETEYERLRRAESRVEKNLWRSRLRRAAESQELTEEVTPDEPPSQDEIAVSVSPSLAISFRSFLGISPPRSAPGAS